jgi:hypothetical protein
MDAFLGPDELVMLTGYKRAADQIAWLRAGGYAFHVNGKGMPAAYAGPDRKPVLQEYAKRAPGLLSGKTIVGRATPIRKVCGIYFLVAGSRVIYVGQSRHIFERVAGHIRKNDIAFEAFYYIQCPAAKLLELEMAYIKSLKPARNVVGS